MKAWKEYKTMYYYVMHRNICKNKEITNSPVILFQKNLNTVWLRPKMEFIISSLYSVRKSLSFLGINYELGFISLHILI